VSRQQGREQGKRTERDLANEEHSRIPSLVLMANEMPYKGVYTVVVGLVRNVTTRFL
jgi:hypothetical protein